MVEGNQPFSEWPVHKLQKLEQVVAAATNASKYLFIWDQQGHVGTFMKYKGSLASLGPEVMKVALNRQSNADVGEFIRKAFINNMRSGDNLCLDVEQTKPDFAAYNVDGTFNADMFFNYEELKKEENYMPLVREDENHGIGGINPGFGYTRMPNFGLVVRCGAETEEEVAAVIAKIPHFNECFHHIIMT